MAVSIGTQLKLVRTEQNLSQADVADRLKITRQTLSKWELEKSLPDLASLKQLAVLYDLSLDSLLAIAEEKIDMLTTYSNDQLNQSIVTGMCGEIEPTRKQTTFLLNEVTVPIMSQLADDEAVWWSVEKQVMIPSRYYMPNHSITTQAAKECLTLFPGNQFRFLFLTKNRLVIVDLFDWLELRTLTMYPLDSFNFLVVGKLYHPSMVKGNSPGMAYKTEHGNFDLLKLTVDDANALKRVIGILDPEGIYFQELNQLSVTQFFKKYHKKGYQT